MQPTVLAKAWKMNGLAFENVNYKEIQLTPGAKKETLQYLCLRREANMCLHRYMRLTNSADPAKMLVHTQTGGTIKH